MRKKYCFFMVIGILIGACTKRENTDFIIDFSATEKIGLSLIADSVKYFELEENDSSFVGSMMLRLCIDNDKMYILDRKTSCIFVYTTNGKLLNKICKQGNGPGEYTDPNCLYVKDDIVYIKDCNAIYQYTSAGEFIKKEIIPEEQFPIDFIPDSSNYLMFYKPSKEYNKNGFYLVSPQKGVIKQIVNPIKSYMYHAWTTYNYCTLKKDLYGFVDYFNGHIYHFNGDSSSIAYTFSLSKKSSDEVLQMNPADLHPSIYTNDLAYYMESDNFIFIISLEGPKQFYTTIYNKKSGETKTGKSLAGENFFNDDLGSVNWLDYPYYYDNKLYVTVESANNDTRRFGVIYLK
ncbi:6-bladed beta-propeller [Parabacteroides pacaensis]|uniref:6-bladed beta-propeller n=1 Tax=Parabacteroides pacaensis TaxID=2086575 RepID=UPI000D10226E|nr:6-bladed beta-propeller [Parabacteroides pacaensis]